MPPWMSLEEREEVPEAQSRASTIAVSRPRVEGSSAGPAPTTPPPTIRMSSSRPGAAVACRAARVSSRSCGLSAPAFMAGPAFLRSVAALERGQHYFAALEFLQVRIASGGHRAAQGTDQVRGA